MMYITNIFKQFTKEEIIVGKSKLYTKKILNSNSNSINQENVANVNGLDEKNIVGTINVASNINGKIPSEGANYTNGKATSGYANYGSGAYEVSGTEGVNEKGVLAKGKTGENNESISNNGKVGAATYTKTGKTNIYNNNTNLPAKRGVWESIKAFLFKEIDVTLTPGQQKFEDFINSKKIEVTMTPKQEEIINKMKKFLLQEVSLGGTKK